MLSRSWRTECTLSLKGCSHVSMSWLMAGCKLTLSACLYPVSVCLCMLERVVLVLDDRIPVLEQLLSDRAVFLCVCRRSA